MMKLNHLIAALMLAVLATLAAVPHAHAYGGLSASGGSGQPRTLQRQDDLQLQAGTIVEGIVLGEASAGEEALLATGLARSRNLLHGSSDPKDYPHCPRCRIVSCSKNRCTGHCRKNGQLFTCLTQSPGPVPKPTPKPAPKPTPKPAPKPTPKPAPKRTPKRKRSRSPPKKK